MKSVRFAQVVERCGRPHVHALWVDPKRDPDFSRAQKADRVMTLEPNGRGKAEYGVIGFHPTHERHNQFLVFPKPLKPFDGARVIGVKFDLIDQPPALAPLERETWQPRRRKPHAAPAVSPPVVEFQPAISDATLTARKRATPPSPRAPHDRGQRRGKRRSVGKSLTSRKSGPDARATERKQTDLAAEVRAALDEMRRGETVAAYERLRSAIEAPGNSTRRK